MSLLETIVALAILLIVSIGIMTMATIAMTTTEDQGHLVARAAEYAQDKMEQLIALAYCDTASDSAQFPTGPSGGTGLGDAATCPPSPSFTLAGSGTVYGSSDPSSPVTGYVDYLDGNGTPLSIVGGAEPATWFYIRVWKFEVPSGTTNLKKITVTAKVRSSIGSPAGALPQTTMVSWKSYPF